MPLALEIENFTEESSDVVLRCFRYWTLANDGIGKRSWPWPSATTIHCQLLVVTLFSMHTDHPPTTLAPCTSCCTLQVFGTVYQVIVV